MKTKIFSLLSLSILALVILTSAVSATITFGTINLTEQTSGTHSFTINVISDQDESIGFSVATMTDENGKTITFTPTTGLFTGSTTAPHNQIITITYNVDVGYEFFEEEATTTILTAIGNNGTLETIDDTTKILTLTFAENSFCEYNGGESGNTGDLSVKISDVKILEGFGDDDEWLPFDEIEVEVEVENNGDEDVDDISVEWGLYNTKTGKWTIEVDEEKDFNLKDGNDEVLTFTLKINNKMDEDLEDLEDGDYILYVRATGEVDITPALDTCASEYEPIKIFIESDFVILNDFELNGFQPEDGSLFSETVSCNSKIQVTADVWNIGDSDQDDVYVMVHNNELGINKKIEIGDIDKFEDEKLTFEFDVPKDAESKWYDLWFTVYDEDDDIYENDYDDDKSEFKTTFKVEGNCVTEPQVIVTATLESGGKAGEELVIKATVTNTGNSLDTYTLNAEGYTEWAELISVEPSTIILEAGKSKDVLMKLNVNKDASGDKLFNIDVLSKDESILKQSVSVTIEKQEFGLSALTGNIISEGNWYLWGIGALNVILVIVIILVALKVSRKSE